MTDPWRITPDTGADILDDIHTFTGRFVAYPNEASHVAHTLWIAHTHFMEHWESTPRIAFLSPEPGSGKSRALEVSEPLVPRPVHAVNTSPAYLFRKVSDPDGTPTLLYDEIDTVFGPKAKDNEDIRGMLNAGHRRGAVAGRCVVKGKIVETEELPAYCAVAVAGLNDVPDTIMTRSVVIRMRRRAPTEKVEPWRTRIHIPEGHKLGARLAEWAYRDGPAITWPDMPDGVEDRNADVWEPLIAVADLAGGDWPHLARVTAVTVVTDTMAGQPSLNVQLLEDIRTVMGEATRMSTDQLLLGLFSLDETPWTDLHGKSLDARSLSRRLAQFSVRPVQWRDGNDRVRGYKAEDLADPWSRYLPPKPPREAPDLSVTSVTSVTASVDDMAGIWS